MFAVITYSMEVMLVLSAVIFYSDSTGSGGVAAKRLNIPS